MSGKYSPVLTDRGRSSGLLVGLILAVLGLWVRTMPAVADVAVGGTFSLSGAYSVHTYTNVGTTNFTLLMDVDVDVLVVGGGGGGGATMGGGGGGGGVLYQETYALTAGVYTVTVGQGGLGGYGYNNTTLPLQAGLKGDNSSFGDDLVAIGGGGGAGWSGHPPTSGGSGGGGNTSTTGGTPGSGTEGQGHGGGIGNNTTGQRSGGGGGGADTAGTNGIANAGGKGGDGREVFGAYYGGGGGGGVEGSLNESGGGAGGLGGGGAGSRGTTYAIAGTPGTGGGGGGAGYDAARHSTIRIGGQGGSGIVIVRYMAATNLTVFGQAATEVGVTNAQVGAMVLGLDASESARVYIVWDTEDHGTNSVSDWLNVVDFGPGWTNLQTVSTNLWTLESNTDYYFRAFASNANEEVWSDDVYPFTTHPVVFGGTITRDGGFVVHSFTNVGNHGFTATIDVDAEVLVVGGGGGGGQTIAGGGGGGGVVYTDLLSLTAGVYAVTVGEGGLGSTWGSGSTYPAGLKGDDSTFGALTALGGAGGAGYNQSAVGTGGSGGGDGANTGKGGGHTEGQGHPGGAGLANNFGGGGGGAGDNGKNAATGFSGDGGSGLAFDIYGETRNYAGGGGGGVRSSGHGVGGSGGIGGGGAGSNTTGEKGVDSTGGGGGGAGWEGGTFHDAGNGGSGIVIVRYYLSSNVFIRAEAVLDIGTTNALIRATVYGDDDPDSTRVVLCWDTQDRGTNSIGDWANPVDLGTGWQSRQIVSTNIWTLEPGTTYYVRAYATNSVSDAWSETAIAFTTHHNWYVATSGSGADGKSWATAFTNLQDALDVATNGEDDVFIAGGEYDVDTEISWTNSGIRILGGYEGTGQPGASDPDQWPTILARPTTSTNRIFNINGISDGVLRGVTVRNGFLRGTTYGAGLYIDSSSLTMDSCIIESNRLTHTTINQYPAGAGLYSLNTTLLMTNCLIQANRTHGGVGAYGGSGHGAGMFISGGDATVVDSRIIANLGEYIGNGRSSGAGIYLNSGSHAIRHTRITDNTGNGHGGGLYMTGVDVAVVENTLVQGNYATISSGGVYMNGGTLRNSLIVSNATANSVGGVHMQLASSRLENVTIVHNTSTTEGSVAGLNQVAGEMVNSIVYFNTRSFDGAEPNISAAGTVTYSCTLPLVSGDGNISSDPDFMNAAAGDFSLRPGSAAEDSATLLDWMDGATDLAGQPRILGAGPDMGCYETGIPDIPLMVNFSADRIVGLDSIQVIFTTLVTGNETNGLTFHWDFNNDGSYESEGADLAVVTNTYLPGMHSVRLRVTNDQSDEDIVTREDYIFVSSSTIYVSLNGDGSDGLSWATAFSNIQDAINFAVGSNAIYIAGNQTFDLDGSLFFADKLEVQILGGYEGVGTPGAYNATNWPTVIRRDAAHGNFRIMSITDVVDGRLARVTIANGNTPTSSSKAVGGGLNIQNSVLEIVDCVLSNNQSNASGNGYVWGGGVYANNATVNIIRTLFVENTAKSTPGSNNNRAHGGGVASESSHVTILDSEFIENAADAQGHHGSRGGAIYIIGGSGMISNTVMKANNAGPNRGRASGGAIYVNAGTTVLDCTIVSNVIRNLEAGYGGGGVYMAGGLLRNSLVADNQADWDGGGIFASGGIIESVTVAGNRITEAGKVAGVFLSGVNPLVTNSIFAANIREFDDADISVSDTGGTLAYSLTVPGRAGTENIDAGPEFVDPDTSDYNLRPSSPAIDAALEMSWMASATDLAGNSRIRGDGPDMGCFEAPGHGEGPLSIGFSADKTTGLDTLDVVFTAVAVGSNTNGLYYQWDFDNNGTFDAEGSDLRVVTNTYAPGIRSVRLRITNELDQEDILIREAYIHVSASEIYVSPDGDGSDGLSWATAFTNIQQALNFASYSNTLYFAGRTFMVAQTINWAGHQNVRIKGGYEADIATVGSGSRDSSLYPTIIARDPAGGNFRPLYLSGLDDCVFEQITVTGGNTIAGGETPVGSGSGGGMRIESSVLEIVDCVFSNNQGNASGNGYGWGGAVYSANSTVAIRGTRFANNRARNGSGSNNARTLGGALAARVGALTVLNCEFIGNDSDAHGHHGSYGGAIHTEGVSGWIRNALVAGNRAGPNRALGLGGGIYLNAGMILENVTVVSNQVWHAGTTAGGIYAAGGWVTNSIVWDNENRTTSAVSDVYAADLNRFAYSCASDLVDGVNNNITTNPMFVSPADGNYRLDNNSPCVDSGLNMDWMVTATDLEGNLRILWGNPFGPGSVPAARVDRGAYEIPPVPGSLFRFR